MILLILVPRHFWNSLFENSSLTTPDSKTSLTNIFASQEAPFRSREHLMIFQSLIESISESIQYALEDSILDIPLR